MDMSLQEPIRIINKNDKPAHRVKFIQNGNLYILDDYITMTSDTYTFLYLGGFDLPVFIDKNANCVC